ncbi:hypothetical protein MKJ04_09935 [Pontibacter sp. E15-1]|uniref:hypothetical protein n=1 Tax=Pontibacter sp. E15-1 TaxID=2919918 RepID=UPI001F4FFE4E|nr:hypothetical protein [Pontibacter sp. E15-1]MCJ8165161.1 hypothetical protein [Pontibacter sp. E15-1]
MFSSTKVENQEEKEGKTGKLFSPEIGLGIVAGALPLQAIAFAAAGDYARRRTIEPPQLF